ncbi:MAG: hypothetical protein HQ515_18105 [Phycisphaeraceae bacterium]|nr:hypothetical protein [Phycisphaeraceae bacterium]
MNQTKKNRGICAGLILFCTLMMASNASASLVYEITGSVVCHYYASDDSDTVITSGIEGAEVYATDCQGNLLEILEGTEYYHDTTGSDGIFAITFPGSVTTFRLKSDPPRWNIPHHWLHRKQPENRLNFTFYHCG